MDTSSLTLLPEHSELDEQYWCVIMRAMLMLRESIFSAPLPDTLG